MRANTPRAPGAKGKEEKMQTSVRIKPLKSSDNNSKSYSLSRSLSHDFREYDEAHIDKNLKSKNITLEKIDKEIILERLRKLKEKYKMVCKNSTIDVAQYIFTVNKNYFDTKEKKEFFLLHVNEFLKNECGEDAVLGVIGHDDEDGYHVHAYAVPLHKTLFKNKYGSEEKLVINYRGKYSHSRQELMEYKKSKRSDETKTGILQTRWAEFAQILDPQLERGKKQSEKEHVTPKQYRRMINEKLPLLKKKTDRLRFDDLLLSETLKKKDEEIKDKELKIENIEVKISQLNQLKEKKESELMNIENTINEKYNEFEALRVKVKNLNMKLYQINYELSESEKSKQNELREISVKEIAKLFGRSSYPNQVKDKNNKTRQIKNAFDYLIYIENMTFSGAVKFLLENYSYLRTSKTIEDKLKNIDGKPELFKVKEEIIRKQFKAIGNPIVRIMLQKTVMNDEGKKEKRGINFTRTDDDKEEFFANVNDIIQLIPKLNQYNALGWNVYVQPVEYEEGGNFEKNIFIFVDDVKDLKRIKEEIGEPNLILESSSKNYQVIYKLPNNINYETSKNQIEEQRKIYNKIFTSLNRIYGDKTISGLRHPFRLAGFTNQKPNRQEHPYVKIIESNPHAISKIPQIFAEALRLSNNGNPDDALKQ